MWYRPFNLNLFYEREFIMEKLYFPEDWHRWGMWHIPFLTDHHENLNEFNDATRTALGKLYIRSFDLLNSYRRTTQAPEEIISTDIFNFYLENKIIGQTYQFQKVPINTQTGLQIQFPLFMILDHQIETVDEAYNYIQRLSKFSRKVDIQIEQLKRYQESGYRIHGFVFEHIEKQIEALISNEDDIEKHVFYKDFYRKINNHHFQIKVIAKEELLYFLKLEIQYNVLPKLKEWLAQLKEIRTQITIESNEKYTDFEDEYYKYLMQKALTKTFENEDLLPILTLRYAELKRQIIYLKYNIDAKDTINYLAKEEYQLADSVKYWLNDLGSRVGNTFGKAPDLSSVNITNTYDFQGSSCYYQYWDGSLDGRKKATLLLNQEAMKGLNPYMPYVLAMAKVFPGYHFLRKQQMRNQDLPLFRRVVRFDFFEEGWQLHSIMLLLQLRIISEPAMEMAIYQHYILRICQAIADINMHNGQWNLEEAVNFVIKTAEVPKSYAHLAIREVLEAPGKYIAAVAGSHFIDQYKQRKQENDPNFDPQKFYSSLLNQSQVTLETLNSQAGFLSDF